MRTKGGAYLTICRSHREGDKENKLRLLLEYCFAKRGANERIHLFPVWEGSILASWSAAVAVVVAAGVVGPVLVTTS